MSLGSQRQIIITLKAVILEKIALSMVALMWSVPGRGVFVEEEFVFFENT